MGKKCQDANFLDEDLLAIINSAQRVHSVTEMDATKTTTENSGRTKDVKILKGRKTISSKDPLKNDCMLVRKLRHKVDNLQKQLQKYENLVRKPTINLLKRDRRMKDAVKSLVAVFEEEADQHSERNAKASFLLCQVIIVTFKSYCSNLVNCFPFQILNFIKAPSRIRYCQWTLKYSIAIQGRSPTTYRFIREHDLLTVPCQNTIVSYTGTTKGEVGITKVNLARLRMIVDGLTKEHEKRVSVEIDEMACKSLLLWIQSRQQFVGEVDFGGVAMDAI